MKTTRAAVAVGILAALSTLVSVLAPVGSLIHTTLVCATCAMATLVATALALSGFLVVYRVHRLERGQEDLFLKLNSSRSEMAIAGGAPVASGVLRRKVAREMLGHDFLVGDEVEVRSAAEIAGTLDSTGCLDGIPMMPEMSKYVGRRARVYRVVDKIYDYGRTRKLRRLDQCVLLVFLRCDGEDHDSCQAGCYLMWKTRWLKRPSEAKGVANQPAPAVFAAPAKIVANAEEVRYFCQYTQLHAASRPLPDFGIAQELRPWVAGNVTGTAYCVSMATRVFNRFQLLRGGLQFPQVPTPSGKGTNVPSERLIAGDKVVVKKPAEIALTLNRQYKNKGLWFDRDMLKHSGRPYVVQGQVDRLIEDATGHMREMKTPCIVLRDVTYSGEFLGLNAQQEHLYWREAWLERRPH